MRIAILSYSLTGNNDALASSVAKALAAEHVRINEPRTRKTGDIMLDMLLTRMPRVQPDPSVLAQYGAVFLIGPVWMGQAASPLRPYLRQIKNLSITFAFGSISGGALNDNPKLADDLQKYAGRKPDVLTDLHIADLLPAQPKPTMKETGAYHLTEGDIAKLAKTFVDSVRFVLEQGLGGNNAADERQ